MDPALIAALAVGLLGGGGLISLLQYRDTKAKERNHHATTGYAGAWEKAVTTIQDSLTMEVQRLRTRQDDMSREFAEERSNWEKARVRIGERLEECETDREELRAHQDAFIDALADGMVFVNRAGRIVRANRRAMELFGWGADLIGQPLDVLIPERMREQHKRDRTTFVNAPVARPMGPDLELFALHHDGHEFRVTISLTPLHNGETVATVRRYGQRKDDERIAAPRPTKGGE